MASRRISRRARGRVRSSARASIGWLAGPAVLGLALIASQGAFAADPNKGREIYTQHCQNCHGPNGVGQFPGIPDFTRGESLLRSDVEIVRSIGAGRGMMPAFRGLFTEEELLDVVAYLRTLSFPR